MYNNEEKNLTENNSFYEDCENSFFKKYLTLLQEANGYDMTNFYNQNMLSNQYEMTDQGDSQYQTADQVGDQYEATNPVGNQYEATYQVNNQYVDNNIYQYTDNNNSNQNFYEQVNLQQGNHLSNDPTISDQYGYCNLGYDNQQTYNHDYQNFNITYNTGQIQSNYNGSYDSNKNDSGEIIDGSRVDSELQYSGSNPELSYPNNNDYSCQNATHQDYYGQQAIGVQSQESMKNHVYHNAYYANGDLTYQNMQNSQYPTSNGFY